MTTTTGELNQIADGWDGCPGGQSDTGEIVSISVVLLRPTALQPRRALRRGREQTSISRAERLSAEQERRLLALEWTKPSVPCDPRCRRDHPNFHRLWQRKTPCQTCPGRVMTRVPAGPQPTARSARRRQLVPRRQLARRLRSARDGPQLEQLSLVPQVDPDHWPAATGGRDPPLPMMEICLKDGIRHLSCGCDGQSMARREEVAVRTLKRTDVGEELREVALFSEASRSELAQIRGLLMQMPIAAGRC